MPQCHRRPGVNATAQPCSQGSRVGLFLFWWCGAHPDLHSFPTRRSSDLTRWLRFAERPSIVVTRFPATAATGVTHERVATPSRWTVHAPHCAMPQPNLVPVRPRESRSTHSSGVSGASVTVRDLPLRTKVIGAIGRAPLRRFVRDRKLIWRPDRWKGEGLLHRCRAGAVRTAPFVPFSRAMTTYARRLGLFSGTMAVIGGTIGGGIFRTPATLGARGAEPMRALAMLVERGGVAVGRQT